jgi:neurotransmitter:Na+ symporter, NSS family
MRQRWSSRTVFLMAAIGSAVGLGNVWRFPYLAYKFGGGAFLIPYLIALFVLGIPLLILEFAIGQKLQKGAIDAFKTVNHRLRGIGVGAIFSGFVVVVYYAVVMAWALIYFVKSFSLELPWAADAKSYFFKDVLNLTSSINNIGGVNLPILLALAAVWFMIYLCVRGGTKSVGKVVMYTVPLPVILLLVLLVRGLTLPGAFGGILYYIKPDFSALFSTEIWLAAVSQIFFTLSLAFGIMIAYASYNEPRKDVSKNAYTTALVNSAISLLAGFVVFSVIGYMATASSMNVPDVVASGPGLAFVTFPQALSTLPWAAPLFSILFFITLLTLGIDSAFSLVEAVNTVITDKFNNVRKNDIAFLVCSISLALGVIFTTGAGLYFLDVFDHFITNFTLVIIGIFESIAIGWVYGADRLRNYINSVSDFRIGKWWEYSIKYITPLILIVLLVFQFMQEISANYEGYPDWAIWMGWSVVIVPLLAAVYLAFLGKE